MALLADLEAPWPGAKGQVKPVPVLGILTSSPLLQSSSPRWGTGQTAEVKEGQLASYNTGKGKLYLRLSKEIKRNFVAE